MFAAPLEEAMLDHVEQSAHYPGRLLVTRNVHACCSTFILDGLSSGVLDP